MNEKWKNKKSMPGEKVMDNSEDNIKLIKNKNTHQTYMD
jgi:hypothetical protein